MSPRQKQSRREIEAAGRVPIELKMRPSDLDEIHRLSSKAGISVEEYFSRAMGLMNDWIEIKARGGNFIKREADDSERPVDFLPEGVTR